MITVKVPVIYIKKINLTVKRSGDIIIEPA